MANRRQNFDHPVRLCVCRYCKDDWNAGKRMSDVVNTLRSGLPWDELQWKWVAFALSDGKWDGVVYDSKRDAVRGQLHEYQCVYISFRNLIGGATPEGMAIFLNFTRDAYDAGFRLPDPDDVNGGRDVIPTAARIDSIRNIIRPVLRSMG